MNNDVRISFTNLPICNLSRVHSIVPSHSNLVKSLRKYEVEDVLVNLLQSHCTNEVPHMVTWIFSSMELNIIHSELWGNFPYGIEVNPI